MEQLRQDWSDDHVMELTGATRLEILAMRATFSSLHAGWSCKLDVETLPSTLAPAPKTKTSLYAPNPSEVAANRIPR